MKSRRELLAEILTEAKPQSTEDVVYIYAAAEGLKNGHMIRDTFVRAFHSREINGKHWRAISWTTAASCCATIELVSKGIIPNKGFVRQEDIDYKDLTGTSFGKMFTDGVAVSHWQHL